MQAAARLDPDAGGDAVPAAQLAQRDAEAVGDGDQGIAAADGVKAGAREGSATGGTGTTSASMPARLSVGLS